MLSREEITNAINTAASMQEAARTLGVPFGTFRARAQKLGVYVPRPNPKRREGISKARKEYLNRVSTPLEEILEGKHPNYKTCSLKERLFDEGIKKRECEECGQGEIWKNKKLTLELDHINGKSDDHRLLNLRILCPNCHSQTPTFRGRKVLPE